MQMGLAGRSLEEVSARSSPSSSGSKNGFPRTDSEDPSALRRGDPPVREPSALPAIWQTLFAGSPREVLSRLVQDDPLGVRGRIAERLRADALLLDGDHVHLRALARISRSAGAYRGRPELSEWVAGAVAESVEELVREMHEEARRRARNRDDRARTQPADTTGDARGARDADAFDVLAGPLGLDPGSMRTACAAFDVLPFADRTAFFDFVLESKDLDSCARAAGVNASEVARRARRALDVILGSVPGFVPDSKPALPPRKEPERAGERPAALGRKP
jgi:hypothetical protein